MPAQAEFRPLHCAVLTLSDTRTRETDTSGDLLVERLQSAGHRLQDRALLPDDLYRLRAQVSVWIADPRVEVILTTGGTGLTGRDRTPEAIRPLLDRHIDGFGELFRQISFSEIGVSMMESRAFAGVANATVIFCLPGSRNACQTGWDRIIRHQLDARYQPCNLVALLPRLNEA
ncbi:MAG: molybdenum cofactor biosynthesis protein B [Pseudomonadota bacterium]